MNLENTMISAITQTNTCRHCIVSLICEILKEKKSNSWKKSRFVVVRNWKFREMGRYWSKKNKPSVIRESKYSTVTIVKIALSFEICQESRS